MMNWTVDISVSNDNVQEAKIEHDKALSKVLGILNENGVQFNEIQTSGIKVSKNRVIYSSDKKFAVTSYVWFTIYEISKYDAISEALIEVDNVNITNTNLNYSKAYETRITARADALNAARKKAFEMASVYEQVLGKPLVIEEESYSYYPSPFNSVTFEYTEDNDKSNSLFVKGTINIVARVKVSFELVNEKAK
jgi:uncharacterized protein YggE